MNNLVLITSVINTPDKPLSYSKVRSVFTREERYEQTKKTIKSIKENIPDYKIMIVECTDFTEEEKSYFEKECDYVLNLWDKKKLHANIFGLSKSHGEGTMTIEALSYIIANNFEYNKLFKISGRYWMTDCFNYKLFDNKKSNFHKINGAINNIYTAFYKIPYNLTPTLLQFLKQTENLMVQYIGYEVLFGIFLKAIKYNNVEFITKMNICGHITVDGGFVVW